MSYRLAGFCAALAAALLLGCGAPAGPYPSREVKLIVQASPGGLSDTISRVVASLAEKDLGVPVVCENRPGASGALAYSYVSRQAPGGYTIGHAAVEMAVVRLLGFADVGPDNVDLLCLVAKSQPVLAVQESSPWQTFRDFEEAVRSRPGYYVVGNAGAGSIWHINAMLMEREMNLRLIHCPFAGSAGSITALLGGHLDAIVAGGAEVVSQVNAGRLRVLLVFDESRTPLFPDAPSVRDEGYNFGVAAWSGFFGPKGLPPEVKATLTRAIRSAVETPQFQKLCEERGIEPAFLESDEFQRFALEQTRFFEATLPKLLGGRL